MRINIKFLLTVLLLAAFSFQPARASSIIVSDTIKTVVVWNVDTVKITGDVTITSEGELTIAPGTRVEFQGYYSIISIGKITAIGAENDSILFTIDDTTGFSDFESTAGGWHGISMDGNVFKFCIFEYIKTLSPNGPVISLGYGSDFAYNHVRHNFSHSFVILLGSDVLSVSFCNVSHNYCSGIKSPNVHSCIITHNRGDGISLSYGNSMLVQGIYGNTISHNLGAGIYVGDCNGMTFIEGNNISFNQEGIRSAKGFYIRSNKIYGNSPLGAINVPSAEIGGNIIYENTYLPQNESDTVKSVINLNGGSFYNNTIVDNYSGSRGGAITCAGYLSLTNEILWGNHNSTSPLQIKLINTGADIRNAYIEHSDIEGGLNGIRSFGDFQIYYKHNIDSLPLFIDLPDGRYQLQDSSPCIDAGVIITSTAFCNPEFGEITRDILGHRRINPPVTDMGAYESIKDSAIIIESSNTICINDYEHYYLELCKDLYHVPYEYYLIKDGDTIPCTNPYYLDLNPISYDKAGTYLFRYYICRGWQEKEIIVSFPKTVQINNQTNSFRACSPTDTSLFVEASSNLKCNLHYAWHKKGTGHLGEDCNTLSLAIRSLTDTGSYYCIISDDCSQDTSEVIHVSTETPPVQEISFVKNDLTVSNYIITWQFASSCTDLRYILFKGHEPYWQALDTMSSFDPLEFIDQQSDINVQPTDFYAFKTLNGFQLLSNFGNLHKPLYVYYSQPGQDTLFMDIHSYEGLDYDYYLLFKGETLETLECYYTIAKTGDITQFINSLLPYEPAVFCAGIVLNSGDTLFSNYYTKPRKNTAPSDITLDNSTIHENAAVGTVIGTLSAQDNDLADNHEFILLEEEGTDYPDFELEGDELKSKTIFDYETHSTYSVRIQAKDDGPGELSYSKLLDIIILDEEEVGLSEYTSNDELIIQPNPFTETTWIRLINPVNQIQVLRIYSTAGELLRKEQNVNSSSYELSREMLVPGMYLLFVDTKEGTLHRMLSVE